MNIGEIIPVLDDLDLHTRKLFAYICETWRARVLELVESSILLYNEVNLLVSLLTEIDGLTAYL